MSLSGGTLAASAACTVTVNVQGTTAGVKNNSVQVTSTRALVASGYILNIANSDLRFFNAPSLRALLADLGFQDVEIASDGETLFAQARW